MNRIIAAVETVIQFCIRKAAKPLLVCLAVYLLAVGALATKQNMSIVSVMLNEFSAIGGALWVLVKGLIFYLLRIDRPAMKSFTDTFSATVGFGAASEIITLTRIVAVWASFLLLIAFSLAAFLRILRFLWGGIPRPFFPWLWRLFFRKGGRFATPSEVAAIRQQEPPSRR